MRRSRGRSALSGPMATRGSDEDMAERLGPVAPPRGWPGAGRAGWVTPARRFAAATTQAAGLFPFVAGSGAPATGVPIGRHLFWGEPVSADPFAWMAAGLTTNTGVFQLGQPGTGKSAFAKRQLLGLFARGVVPVVLGDTKGEYSALVARLGGRVVHIGRGRDRLNPLDAGPLQRVLPTLPEQSRRRLEREVRRRRVSSLLALCAVVRGPRGGTISNGEEVVLAAVVDHLSTDLVTGSPPPTVRHVLATLREPPPVVEVAAEADSRREYDGVTQQLRWTLNMLCDGTLAGLFDEPSNHEWGDVPEPLAVDLSSLAGAEAGVVSAAMLATWSWGFAAVEGMTALAEEGRYPRLRWLIVMDELWRALRGGPGLVDHADAMTRLNRSRGIASLMITHSLADLEALPSTDDVAKARGFVDRAALVVLGGLPPRELADVSKVVPMTDAERHLVSSWGSAESWRPGATHPGRGKYLLKTGDRVGIPVAMHLTAIEHDLYDTDAFVRAP